MRKVTSTNALNEELINKGCGVAYTISLIGGRWKPAILWCLLRGKKRYSELRDDINGVSERVLVLQLRELEKDQLIKRTVYPEVPPRVEYEITPLGLSMEVVLQQISDWGVMHRHNTATAAGVSQ